MRNNINRISFKELNDKEVDYLGSYKWFKNYIKGKDTLGNDEVISVLYAKKED